MATYSNAEIADTWDSLSAMGNLFRIIAIAVSNEHGFTYPEGDDSRVCAYLNDIRNLPHDFEPGRSARKSIE